MRVDFGQCTSYGTNQHQPYITQQSNGVGVRFLCGDDGRKAFIWDIMPDFYYFGASKMGWFFTYSGIDGTLFNAWDKQTTYKPTEDDFSKGLWCYLGVEDGLDQHGNNFYLRIGTTHTFFRTTIFAANEPMMPTSGKNASTQQSNGMAERFLLVDDGHWPMWQPTTSDLVVTFFVQNQLVWMELAAVRMIEETTIYKKNRYYGYNIYEGVDVLIAMIGRSRLHTIHN